MSMGGIRSELSGARARGSRVGHVPLDGEQVREVCPAGLSYTQQISDSFQDNVHDTVG